MTFRVDCSELKERGVYSPAEDTFLLVDFVENVHPVRVAADVGCGNGLATLKLSSRSEYTLAIDISQEAVKAAKQRLEGNVNVDIIVADRLSPLRDKSLEIIISNPPYLPCDYCEEPLWCGGERGVEFAAGLAEQARSRLKKNGTLVLVLSSLSDLSSFFEHAASIGFEVSIVKESPLGFFERIYILRCTLRPPA